MQQHVVSSVKLTHGGLNPAHVHYWWVTNPALGEFCFTVIGRHNMEESKSNLTMNIRPPLVSYPYGNFSDTQAKAATCGSQ